VVGLARHVDILAVWGYRFAVWVAPRLPERFGFWLFARLGDLAYLFNTNGRANYLKNLKHVIGTDEPQSEYDRITRKAFQNSLKNYFDLFRGHALNEAQVYGQLASVEGLEHLDNAIALGKGIAGGSAHFGNFNMFVHLTAVHLHKQHEVVVPVERLKPEAIHAIVTKQRAAQGIELVPSDAAGRVLLKKLRAGAILGLAIDLDPTRTGPIVNFFGAPAQLPDGAALLSIKFNAPLILAFNRRLDDNKCAVVIEPPLELERTGDLQKDARAAVEKIAARMEFWIRQYPEQWILFSPVWQEDKNDNAQ
jgi:lauroyl/myristoyl acyltransferase